MRCSEINDLIMKYFDQNISSFEMEQIRKHNETCTSCREEFEALKEIISDVESLPELEPSVNFESEIMAKIKMQAQKEPVINPKLLTAGIIGMVGIIVFTFSIIINIIIPYIWSAEFIVAAYNTAAYGVSVLIQYVTLWIQLIMAVLNDLMVIRDIMLGSYMSATFILIGILFIGNLVLIKTLKLQQDYSN